MVGFTKICLDLGSLGCFGNFGNFNSKNFKDYNKYFLIASNIIFGQNLLTIIFCHWFLYINNIFMFIMKKSINIKSFG